MNKNVADRGSRVVPIGLMILAGIVALVCVWLFSAVAILAFGPWGAVALGVILAAIVVAAILVRRAQISR